MKRDGQIWDKRHACWRPAEYFSGQPDALRFCVVRETTNTYQVTVYDPAGRILRENSAVPVHEIMDKIGYELEQLRSRSSEPSSHQSNTEAG